MCSYNCKPWFIECAVGPKGYDGATGPAGFIGPTGIVGPTQSNMQPQLLAETDWSLTTSINTVNTTSGFPLFLPFALIGATIDVSSSITLNPDIIGGFIGQVQTGAEFTVGSGTITYTGAASDTFIVETQYMGGVGPTDPIIYFNVGPLINGTFVANSIASGLVNSINNGVSTVVSHDAMTLNPGDVVSIGNMPVSVAYSASDTAFVIYASLKIYKLT